MATKCHFSGEDFNCDFSTLSVQPDWHLKLMVLGYNNFKIFKVISVRYRKKKTKSVPAIFVHMRWCCFLSNNYCFQSMTGGLSLASTGLIHYLLFSAVMLPSHNWCYDYRQLNRWQWSYSARRCLYCLHFQSHKNLNIKVLLEASVIYLRKLYSQGKCYNSEGSEKLNLITFILYHFIFLCIRIIIPSSLHSCKNYFCLWNEAYCIPNRSCQLIYWSCDIAWYITVLHFLLCWYEIMWPGRKT